MKKNALLRGILLASLLITGCNQTNNKSSNSNNEGGSLTSSTTSSKVEKDILTSISVVLKSSKTTYQLDDKFVTPLVRAHYENKDDVDVSELCTYEGFDSSKKGEIEVKVTYKEDDVTVETKYKVTITDKALDFETALAKIASLQNEELTTSNKAVTVDTTVSGKTEDIVSQEITNYADNSSSANGTYTRKTGPDVELTDTFKAIKTKVTDKYKFEDDTTASFDMFVSIKDFKNNASSNYYYTDKVSKQFIVGSEKEAQDAGLSANSYIIRSQYAANASANMTAVLYNFIGGYMYGNIYLETLGMGAISEQKTDDGYEYSFNATYSYSGEGTTKVNEELILKYKLNSTKSKLLSFNYSYLVTEGNSMNPDDHYVSGFKNSSTISYGEKPSEKTDILNVDDYFLRTITEIKIKARNSNFDDVDVDPTNISSNYSYIFAYASKYYPATAVDVELNAEFSSDTNVVALENGKFKIVGQGNSTLYFSYYQKIDGIYELAYKTVNVTITAIQVESISLGTYQTNFYQQYGLSTSLTYDWPVHITPYKADTAITAVSSDESVLKVEIVREREVRIIPVGKGRATVTITSVSNPNATATKEFYVLDPATNWAEYLTKTTFKHSSPYGYTFVMKFNPDGTGTRVRTINETGEERNDTFSYTLTGNVIKFSNFSSKGMDDNSYVSGIIIKEFSKAGEPFGIYCETTEKGQAYYAL